MPRSPVAVCEDLSSDVFGSNGPALKRHQNLEKEGAAI